MLLRSLCCLSLAGLALAPLGCGSRPTKVEGVVTLDGEPVEGATLTFAPADEKGRPATARTDSRGVFTVFSDGKPGLPAGTYKVLVVKTEELVDTSALPKDPTEATLAMMKSGKMDAPGQGGPMAPGGQPKGPKSLLPAKYGNAATTPFTFTFPTSDKLDLKLTKS